MEWKVNGKEVTKKYKETVPGRRESGPGKMNGGRREEKCGVNEDYKRH